MAKTRRSAKATRRGTSPGAKGKSKRPKKAPVKKARVKAVKATKSAGTRLSAGAVLQEPETSINLKKLRGQFALMLSALAKKSGSTPTVQMKLDDTRKRVSQWMTDIDDICTPEEEEICGATMVFPIP